MKKKAIYLIFPMLLLGLTACETAPTPLSPATTEKTEQTEQATEEAVSINNVSALPYLNANYTLEFSVEDNSDNHYDNRYQGEMEVWTRLNTIHVDQSSVYDIGGEEGAENSSRYIISDATGTTRYFATDSFESPLWEREETAEKLVDTDFASNLTLYGYTEKLEKQTDRVYQAALSGEDMVEFADAFSLTGIELLPREIVSQMSEIPVYYQTDEQGNPQIIELDFTDAYNEATPGDGKITACKLALRFSYEETECKLPDFTKEYDGGSVIVEE